MKNRTSSRTTKDDVFSSITVKDFGLIWYLWQQHESSVHSEQKKHRNLLDLKRILSSGKEKHAHKVPITPDSGPNIVKMC